MIYNEDEQAKVIFQEEDKVAKISEKYEIKSWISVNSFVSISLSDWLYLDTYIKKAIIKEVNEIAQNQEKEMRAKKQEVDALKAQVNSSLKFQNLSPFIHNYTK